ncbi:hypothetical protein GCM10027168_52720 [Streptomyces capparidis]
MTRLTLADTREAADLAAFLARLLHYDKAAAVRLRAHGTALAVFGHPPFDVLAIRAVRLADEAELDVTVSAGRLLDGLDDDAATAAVPEPVTGPPWAGLLPPRGGWRRVAELPLEAVRRAVAQGVAEFRARTESLPADRRTRAELDRVAAEIWSRSLDAAADLPLRAVHAAHSLGFLRPARVPAQPHESPEAVVVLASGTWLRLRTAYGSVALRRSGGPGLSVTPVSS